MVTRLCHGSHSVYATLSKIYREILPFVKIDNEIQIMTFLKKRYIEAIF